MEQETMYILCFEHREKAKPLKEPIKLMFSISPSYTIEYCLFKAIPSDESMELVSCWIEVRFPPYSLRKPGWKPGD